MCKKDWNEGTSRDNDDFWFVGWIDDKILLWLIKTAVNSSWSQSHFEVIANEASRKIMDLSVDFNVPIGFGILTCYNLEQAITRSDINQKNKNFSRWVFDRRKVLSSIVTPCTSFCGKFSIQRGFCRIPDPQRIGRNCDQFVSGCYCFMGNWFAH